jgi:Tetratricopeptide repeat
MLRSINNPANTYSDQNRTGEAAALLEDVLEKQRQILEAEHPDTLRSMNNLAIRYGDQGRRRLHCGRRCWRSGGGSSARSIPTCSGR